MDIPPNSRMVFEVIGKEAAWTQFARITADPGEERGLGDEIGERVTMGPFAQNAKISFEAYSRDPEGEVRESVSRVNDQGNEVWLIEVEDGGGSDYDDYIIRASVVGALPD